MMPSSNKEPVDFFINVIIEEGIDEYGRMVRRTQWQKCDHKIELGSMKNPKNEKIIGFKWKERNQMEKLFGLFDM